MTRVTRTSKLAQTYVAAIAVGLLAAGIAAPAAGADAEAAQALMKKSGCFKCHSLTREKDAPSYKEIAKKLKGKPDAEQELFKHLTTNPKVKVDGKEETHDSLKTKDEAEVRNVIQFVLSQ